MDNYIKLEKYPNMKIFLYSRTNIHVHVSPIPDQTIILSDFDFGQAYSYAEITFDFQDESNFFCRFVIDSEFIDYHGNFGVGVLYDKIQIGHYSRDYVEYSDSTYRQHTDTTLNMEWLSVLKFKTRTIKPKQYLQAISI